MKFKRASGILLHPTSLPGDFGIGDFGPAAYEFIDFLRRARQSLWQMLPLGPTGYGDSPYQCYSAFAGNTLLISPEKLVEYGLLDSDQIDRAAVPSKGRVDYGSVTKSKADLLHLTFQNYADGRGAHLREMFHVFMREHAWWLDDYALFRAVREAEGNKPWYEWDEPLRLREPEALTNAANDLSESLLREKFSQYLFFAQYSELQSYAAANDVQLIGDIPIFVALDSSDVWCNQRKFKLHEDGHPKVVSGVPPDYFSKTGQLWGNPIYEWDEMRRDGFHWWVARVAFSLRMFDIVRVDHFRGFSGVWEVPGSDKTAEHGRWADVPGREIFEALRRNLGELPLIATASGSRG
jgi:4-alpha-glucanotransferase